MRALLLATLLAALPTAGQALGVPALTGPVMDEAGVLSASDLRRLETLARQARAVDGRRGVQLQYLLVPGLEGDPIEDYAIRVAEAWKLGDAGRDNGLLIVVALADRKVRIEVGNGVEGALTDAQSARIIRSAIGPAFRAGRYGDGLYQAGLQALQALNALPEGVQAAPARTGKVGSRFGGLLMAALVVLFIIIRAVFGLGFGGHRRGFRGGGWGGGGFGGGGFGGGGFGGSSGGGGWSGGGGGFSGGGASGSW